MAMTVYRSASAVRGSIHGKPLGIGRRGAAPHLDLRAQTARRVEQDGKARAVDLVVDLGVGALEHGHRATSSKSYIARNQAAQRSVDKGLKGDGP